MVDVAAEAVDTTPSGTAARALARDPTATQRTRENARMEPRRFKSDQPAEVSTIRTKLIGVTFPRDE
jgi:hypothetical protein